MTKCPICEHQASLLLLEEPDLPVLINQQYESALAAKNAPRGKMSLAACQNCGHLYNQVFDPALLDYSAQYENALHYSGVFRQYQQDLAEEIAGALSVRGARVLEIGAGQGDFLSLLLQNGAGYAVGYDPSFRGRKMDERLVVYPQLFTAAPKEKFDVAIARHVFEHLEAPVELLNEIAAALNSSGRLYLEVPNALYTIEEMGVWDLIYEHRSYFTPFSLKKLIDRAGFGDVIVSRRYANQFLCAYAWLAKQQQSKQETTEVEEVLSLAVSFGRAYEEKRRNWQQFFCQCDQQELTVVVWGAGSKGCAFANYYQNHPSIKHLVDLNPLKVGKFAAGSGLEIVSPETLTIIQPDVVVLMNSIYQPEVMEILNRLNINPRIEAA